jgi:hypothetical protein
VRRRPRQTSGQPCGDRQPAPPRKTALAIRAMTARGMASSVARARASELYEANGSLATLIETLRSRPFHKSGAGCAACPRCWRSRRTAVSSSCASSNRRRHDAYAAPRRRRTRARSRRLALRLREQSCSPAPTPRCRSSSGRGARWALRRVAARPREREPVCFQVVADQAGSKHTGGSRNRGKGGQPVWPISTPDRRAHGDAHHWRIAGADGYLAHTCFPEIAVLQATADLVDVPARRRPAFARPGARRPRRRRVRTRSGRCATRCSPTRAGLRARTCGHAPSAWGLEVERFEADRRSDAARDRVRDDFRGVRQGWRRRRRSSRRSSGTQARSTSPLSSA